jgi:ArsR family transcriptional regulator, arsenate/arsenite/antimonite-responsive transcriptional repressor
MMHGMNLVRIHECLCDRTRLRLVHLLLQRPLCVCHLRDVLVEPQAKISRHLAYLRRKGMVETERNGKWVVYRLPARRPPLLETNLACLQDCAAEEAVFRRDLQNLSRLLRLPPLPRNTTIRL